MKTSDYGNSIAAEMGDSAREILSANKISVTMTVNDFRTKWADRLLVDNNLTEKNTTEWVKTVTGNPYREVQLIDEKNKVIGTIPSFCSSTSKYFRKDFNVTEHMSRIRNASSSGAVFKVAPLYNKLIDEVQDNPTPIEDLKKWVTVAEYFKYTPNWLPGFKAAIEFNTNPNSTKVTTGAVLDDPFTEFESV
jgi:hypothetical protein